MDDLDLYDINLDDVIDLSLLSPSSSITNFNSSATTSTIQQSLKLLEQLSKRTNEPPSIIPFSNYRIDQTHTHIQPHHLYHYPQEPQLYDEQSQQRSMIYFDDDLHEYHQHHQSQVIQPVTGGHSFPKHHNSHHTYDENALVSPPQTIPGITKQSFLTSNTASTALQSHIAPNTPPHTLLDKPPHQSFTRNQDHIQQPQPITHNSIVSPIHNDNDATHDYQQYLREKNLGHKILSLQNTDDTAEVFYKAQNTPRSIKFNDTSPLQRFSSETISFNGSNHTNDTMQKMLADKQLELDAIKARNAEYKAKYIEQQITIYHTYISIGVLEQQLTATNVLLFANNCEKSPYYQRECQNLLDELSALTVTPALNNSTAKKNNGTSDGMSTTGGILGILDQVIYDLRIKNYLITQQYNHLLDSINIHSLLYEQVLSDSGDDIIHEKLNDCDSSSSNLMKVKVEQCDNHDNIQINLLDNSISAHKTTKRGRYISYIEDLLLIGQYENLINTLTNELISLNYDNTNISDKVNDASQSESDDSNDSNEYLEGIDRSLPLTDIIISRHKKLKKLREEYDKLDREQRQLIEGIRSLSEMLANQ